MSDSKLNVLDSPYSASGDGLRNDGPAIQRALDDAAASQATVVVPAGATCVVGDLRVHGNTTLRIDGVLRQATDPSFYNYRPERGHNLPGGYFGSHLASWTNFPLILASHASDVTITGTGTIEMMGGDEDTIINIAPIGLYRVTDFEVSGLTILNSDTWTVNLFTTNRGVVKELTMRSRQLNSDGVSIMNSQDIRVTGCDIDTADDGIYVRTSWDETALFGGSGWWSSRWPQPSRNIEIDHNKVTSVTRGFAFIPWGMRTDDLASIEISDVRVHDNVLTAPQPISCWNDDPHNGDAAGNRSAWMMRDYDNHVPIKSVAFANNECRTQGIATTDATEIQNLRLITDLSTDFAWLSWPGNNVDTTKLDSLLPNGDFEMRGALYWSTRGDAGACSAADLRGLTVPDARDWAERLSFQADSWGWFGYLQGSASLYQGLGLQASQYEFSLALVTSAEGAELFAHDTSTNTLLVSRNIVATEPVIATLEIPVQNTSGNIHIGVRLDTGWALVNNARIRRAHP